MTVILYLLSSSAAAELVGRATSRASVICDCNCAWGGVEGMRVTLGCAAVCNPADESMRKKDIKYDNITKLHRYRHVTEQPRGHVSGRRG